ncbi:MAG: 50S ribosomal protein L15 [Rhodospirillaceae bacterium]
MKLNQICDNDGATKARMRVGRGIGSGKGKTCGRGVKGQKARTGVAIKGFEGGQMPLSRRLPKRGFNPLVVADYAEVNVGRIQQAIEAGRLNGSEPVTALTLQGAGLVRDGQSRVRLLGKGTISAKLTICVTSASKGAIALVESAGGNVSVK